MQLYHVDAFTNQIFKGNPAGVCILPEAKLKDSHFLQNIAAEMNLSETAFLSKQNNEYRLRWFSPETEVEFCGHATLSAAHILWETGLEKRPEVIQFDTLAGKLFARFKQDKVELDFPVFEVKEVPDQENIDIALGLKPVFTGITKDKYFIEVENLTVLKDIQPDYAKLKEIGRMDYIVTCKSDDQDYDFYSRFFAPAIGINEDPVTGSSHSSLAPYWSKKLGKSKLLAYQASKRGGILECELSPNGRVFIRGQALTVFEINMKEE
jgi:PhzF family phenazine biosynthesis protein